jgi:type IV pilus assembly protein PilY1
MRRHLSNLREDSDGNGRLILKNTDKIIRFKSDGSGKIDRYIDSDGDGDEDGTPETVSLSAITPIWEGGKMLAKMNASARKIYTFVDLDNDNNVDSEPNNEFISFNYSSPDNNTSTLKPYLRAGDDTEAANIIRFIRGEDVSGFRKRTVNVDGTPMVWKLGDIIYSTPTVVGRPIENMDFIYTDGDYLNFYSRYKDRETVVYVGANDGMLHAFSACFYDKNN